MEPVDIRLELFYHYPWLPSLKNKISHLSKEDPIEFIEKTFDKYNPEEVKVRILSFFKAAFDNLEYIDAYKIDDLNIRIYLILKILLFNLNSKPISNKIANLYSKVTYRELMSDNDANVHDICVDLELDFKYYAIPIKYGKIYVEDYEETLETNFTLYYIDFLKLASKLKDDYRKLVHNSLSKGYVFIERRRLLRLLQEHVRIKFIIEEKDKATINYYRDTLLNNRHFKELYEEILHYWELKKDSFEFSAIEGYEKGVEIYEFFPPCVKEILSRAKEGQNLIHIERLFLVFFLHALNYPKEEIVKIFSTLPDFDIEKTTYQVEFAKKKNYTPHSCDTLKSYNLCKAEKYKDELCIDGYYSKKYEEQKKISHPVFYFQFKKYVSSNKNKKTNSN